MQLGKISVWQVVTRDRRPAFLAVEAPEAGAIPSQLRLGSWRWTSFRACMGGRGSGSEEEEGTTAARLAWETVQIP